MAENRVKVAGLASDDMGCGHYRLINPVAALNDVGYDARWALSWTDFTGIAEEADIIILQRCTVPQAIEAVREWRKHKLVLYELDDLIHDVPTTNPVFVQYKQGSPILVNATRIMRECDGMIVSSYELWRYYQRINGNVLIIPNFIDFRLRDWDTPFPRGSRLAIGWSGGSQHQSEIDILRKLMRFVLLRYRDVDFVLYCHPHFAQSIVDADLPLHRLIVLPVRSFRDYPHHLGALDIGLAPLVNTRFNRAKCVHASTAVWTPKGHARVADLKPGDWVWNGNRFVHVLAKQHDGETIGVRVYLECGLSLDMTLDHRVLTSIGWLNAGKLRKGDMLQLLRPHYTGYGQKRYEPKQAAWILASAFAGTGCLVREGFEYMPRRSRRMLEGSSIRDVFVGWSDADVSEFMNELIQVAGRTSRRGVLYIKLTDDELVQCIAEFCLILGIGCRAKRLRHGVRLDLTPDSAKDYSRIVGIHTVWLDAVDIQVEGELFAANGIASHNSSLKPLEYMARGVVTLASNIAEYRLLQKQGAPVVLVDGDPDWFSAIARMVEDADYRSRWNGASWVREHYDLHKNIYRYVQAFQQFTEWKLAGRRGAVQVPPLERNSPCPCGSGERYRRCCYPAFG